MLNIYIEFMDNSNFNIFKYKYRINNLSKPNIFGMFAKK